MSTYDKLKAQKDEIVARERAKVLLEGIAYGIEKCAEFLEREADANFMPNEPARILLKAMASALRINIQIS